MKDSTMKLFKEMSVDAEKGNGPFSGIANASLQQGIVLVTKLEEAVAASDAKYDVQYEDAQNGSWCKVYVPEVRKDENGEVIEDASPQNLLVAQGYSGAGREDALLHAVYGAVREEYLAAHEEHTLHTLKSIVK